MNVFKWSKKELVQAWHMQRSKLEEQDRQIKKLVRLSVEQDRMIGEKNLEIQRLKRRLRDEHKH